MGVSADADRAGGPSDPSPQAVSAVPALIADAGDCFLCAGKCRGHSMGHQGEWEPEVGSRAYWETRLAKALFLAEHPNAEWSAGRARAIWFLRANAALCELARDSDRYPEGAETSGSVGEADRARAEGIAQTPATSGAKD